MAGAELARVLMAVGADLTHAVHGDWDGGCRSQPVRAAELEHRISCPRCRPRRDHAMGARRLQARERERERERERRDKRNDKEELGFLDFYFEPSVSQPSILI